MRKREEDLCRKKLVLLREKLTARRFGDGSFGLHGQDSCEVQSNSNHLGDVGTEISDRDFQLSLASNESDLLREIELAFIRIEEGEYGVCLECKQKINPKRLLAIPYVSNCVPCQEKLEKNM